jgi:hypothetical protein
MEQVVVGLNRPKLQPHRVTKYSSSMDLSYSLDEELPYAEARK